MERPTAEADDDPTPTPQKLIERIEEILRHSGADEGKLRRALSLAAEAVRTPHGGRKRKLIRDARELLRQALEGDAS
jgi:hypothetical protein